MQAHVKIYTNYFHLGIDDIVSCENCGHSGNINNGFDLHHINGRIGKDKNHIGNLILLCRECHTAAHAEKITKEELQKVHNTNLIR